MFDGDDLSTDLSIDCATCIGAGTTACTDCIVTHLFANDDGPIGYVPVDLRVVPALPTPDEVAIDLLQKAGLLGAAPEFVPADAFESGALPPAPGGRRGG